MASKSMQRAGPQLPPVAKYMIGIVGAISVIVFLYATHHHDMWMRQITKPWPVVGLILLVAEATFLVPHRTNVSILAALVFCLLGSYNFALPTLLQFGAPPNVCKRNFFFFLGSVFPPALTFYAPIFASFSCPIYIAASFFGDILLEIEGMFLHGLIAFLIGHLGYIYAFGTLSIARNKMLYIPFFMYAFSFYWLCHDKLGDLQIPVVFYTIILGLMAGGAAGTFQRGKESKGTLTALLIPVGASLFTLSDSLIAVNRFYNTNTWSLRYIIILTYWAGQLMITIGSLRLMNEPQRAKKLE